MIVVGAEGLRSIKPYPPLPLSHCIFEHVYFARPDSIVFGDTVGEVRRRLGAQLARMEARIAFSRLMAKFSKIEPCGAPQRDRRIRFRGFRTLPVRIGV